MQLDDKLARRLDAVATTAGIAAVRAPGRCAGLVLANSIGYDSWPIPSVRALRAARR